MQLNFKSTHDLELKLGTKLEDMQTELHTKFEIVPQRNHNFIPKGENLLFRCVPLYMADPPCPKGQKTVSTSTSSSQLRGCDMGVVSLN